MEPGNKINDRYEIIRLLGEGGMGNVYLVKDFVENRIVALKLIKEKFFSNKAVDRFKNEFKMVSQLKHKNIIRVHDLDVYKETDTYFFTMEYVEGQNLTDAFPDLSYKEKLEILLQISRGLNYIHNRHIIHFDIKTDNIFLIRSEAGYTAKIMDFGLANFAEDFSGKVRGTLVYIAPEVLMKKDIDYRVDLYSLGMVIYYIFSGKLPFDECKSVKEIMKKKVGESFKTEPAFESISEKFIQNLIKDLCAARKEERIDNAAQLMLYIETALEMNIKESEERIHELFNNDFYDKDGLLSDLQDEYLNFCLRTEKKTGMLNTVVAENGNGKTQLLETLNIKSQLTRLPSLYLTVEKEESIVNIFFRKLIFGLIGFLEKNEESRNIFIEACDLIDQEGAFLQDRDIIFKTRSLLKKIFDNLYVRQSLMLLIDDADNLEGAGRELMLFVMNLAVTSPVFIVMTADIDRVESEKLRLDEYEDAFYLLPPKRFYITNLKPEGVIEYIAFLLKIKPQSVDAEIVPHIMKESNGNLFLIKSYLEFLLTHKYLEEKGGCYQFEFPEKRINYNSKIIDIYQARFSNLSLNEKFIFLFIAGKFDEGASVSKIKTIFDIQDLENILIKLIRMSLIDFRIKRGDKYYFIRNENFSKVIRSVSSADRKKFYDRLTEYYGRKKKRSLITYTYCLIKSSAEGKVKKKQLKETIEYCRENNLNVDRKNFLIFFYKSFKLTSKTSIPILQELYLLLISMGSFDESYTYYNELLSNIRISKRSPEYAQIISDSVCFSRSQISLHKKSEYLKRSCSIFLYLGDYESYLRVLCKRLTFLARTGRMSVCSDLIDRELLKRSDRIDKDTKSTLESIRFFYKNAGLIQRSEIYLKLVHIYKYLEADFVYPGDTLDIGTVMIFDMIVSRRGEKAAGLCRSFLSDRSGDRNKIEDLTFSYIYANLMHRAGNLRRAYDVFSDIEDVSVKKNIGNNLVTVIVDKIDVMTSMRKSSHKVAAEFDKALMLGKRFKDFLGLFRIYSKYVFHLVGTGKWRDVEINIRFAMNLIRKVSNRDEINRFIVNLIYYHYIIKDPEGFFSILSSIKNIHPELEKSNSFTGIQESSEVLFGMYSRENSEKVLQCIGLPTPKLIKLLMIMKYFNNSLNNYDEGFRNDIITMINDLKKSFSDMPYLLDYLIVLDLLLNEDYVNSLKTTVKLGKYNYSKGYIFDSYFPILSSYFYFKNRSLYRNSEFFEEKLNLLSSRIASNMPAEKRDGFLNRYWVI